MTPFTGRTWKTLLAICIGVVVLQTVVIHQYVDQQEISDSSNHAVLREQRHHHPTTDGQPALRRSARRAPEIAVAPAEGTPGSTMATIERAARKQRLLCMFPVGRSAAGHGMKRGHEFGLQLAKLLIGDGRCDGVHLYSVIPVAAQVVATATTPISPPTDRLGMSIENIAPGIAHIYLTLSHESEVYENHFEKLYHIYAFAYVRELEQWDWFVKIDTDSVFIPENFHRMLVDLKLDGRDSLFVGHQLNHRDVPINVGCAYAVSQGALRAVGPELIRLPFTERIGNIERSDLGPPLCQGVFLFTVTF